jgi:glycine/D-amino acid oxidase-like deaminating enzyme
MTPDYSPLVGTTDVEGFYLNAGWGTWGFKATPIAGVTMAELVARVQSSPAHAPSSSKTSSGINAPTTQFGASTTSWMRRSAATLVSA